MSTSIKIFISIIVLASICLLQNRQVYAQTSLDAQVSLGTMKVSNEVKVTLIDGSVVTLKNESYPIYPDMIIDTLDNGKATLIVNGGKYVIEPHSVFKVQSIGDGYTGLLLAKGDKGEVCYCFNPKGGFMVDTPEADTIPQKETVTQTGAIQYVDGRTNVKDNITSAIQFDGHANFKTNLNTQTLNPGDAISNPQIQNPYGSFENKSGCCTPSAAPLLIPGTAGAAAVTGAILGATLGNNGNDNTASTVIP